MSYVWLCHKNIFRFLLRISSWLHFCISLSPIFLVLLFVTATVGETLKDVSLKISFTERGRANYELIKFLQILPYNIYMASKKFNNVVCLRRFAAIVIIFSVAFSNILDMVSAVNYLF